MYVHLAYLLNNLFQDITSNDTDTKVSKLILLCNMYICTYIIHCDECYTYPHCVTVLMYIHSYCTYICTYVCRDVKQTKSLQTWCNMMVIMIDTSQNTRMDRDSIITKEYICMYVATHKILNHMLLLSYIGM